MDKVKITIVASVHLAQELLRRQADGDIEMEEWTMQHSQEQDKHASPSREITNHPQTNVNNGPRLNGVIVDQYYLNRRAKLRETMVSLLSLDELNDVCFDLGIEFENLPGETRNGKVRQLISYCERRSLMDKLFIAINSVRPSANI